MPRSLKSLGNLQKHTFQLLVFLAPSQLAKHFWPNWSLVWGIRVDYLAPAIYLTDLLIIVLLCLWFVELMFQIRNNKDVNKRGVSNKNIISAVIVIVFALVNIYLSEHVVTSFLKWLKLFEFILLSAYVSKSKLFEYKSWFIKPLSFSVMLFSTIAIIQFIGQKTTGRLFYYLGERNFTKNTPGIALVGLLGKEYLRPYSTFGHPNAMGGYFLVTSLLFLDDIKEVDRKSLIMLIALIFSVVGVILSFSEGVMVAAIIVLIYLFLSKKFKMNNKRLVNILLLVFIVFSLLSPVVFGKLQRSTVQLLGRESIIKRIELTTISGNLINKHPFVGVGLNNFIYQLPDEGIGYSVVWWLQPVHNIFLLLFTEAGFVGVLIVVYMFNKALNNSTDNNEVVVLVLLIVIFTGSLDHYWLTLQQNLIILFIVFGLAFRDKQINDKIMIR